MSSAIHTAIVVAVTSGLFVMIFGQFIAKPVLLRMGTMEDVIELAVLYLWIYLLGMPFIMLYDFGSSILRSIGDSEHLLYSLIAAVCKRVHEFWVLMIIYPISWVVTGIAMMIAYTLLRRKILAKSSVNQLE